MSALALSSSYLEKNYPKTLRDFQAFPEKAVSAEIKKYRLSWGDYYTPENIEKEKIAGFKNSLVGIMGLLDGDFTLKDFISIYEQKVLPVSQMGTADYCVATYDSKLSPINSQSLINNLIVIARKLDSTIPTNSYSYQYVDMDGILADLISKSIIKGIVFLNDTENSDIDRRKSLMLYVDYGFSLPVEVLEGLVTDGGKELSKNPFLVTQVLHDYSLAARVTNNKDILYNSSAVFGNRTIDLEKRSALLTILAQIATNRRLPTAGLEKGW